MPNSPVVSTQATGQLGRSSELSQSLWVVEYVIIFKRHDRLFVTEL